MAARRHGGTALLVTFALLALALLFFVPQAGAQTNIDYDTDDDRLIEIDTPAKLNAIRHDLTGAGTATHADYVAAFPSPAAAQCPTSCQGYELTADLDLSGYASWSPIGADSNASTRYQARFNGNGHTISNMTIAGGGNSNDFGLFGSIHSTARIEYVGVVGANVTAGSFVGILVGSSYGPIAAVFTTGQVRGTTYVGGVVGWSQGLVTASYSTASATATAAGRAGGLVGRMQTGTVSASYSTGAVSGASPSGGLVGERFGGTVTNGYYNSQTSGYSDTGKGEPRTRRQLQTPIDYTGDYLDWNVNVDGVDGVDDPWDFGSPRTYPLLKADKDGDGTATCREFGGQRCYREPGPPPYNWRADHPEIYANARHNITAACVVRTTGAGDEAVTTSTLTFDLAEYTRPITLALSLWDKTHFRSLQSLGIAMPQLQREGQTATVEVVTDPARTRFRLDGQYGLNLVLGYADCHTDDS